MHLFAKQQRISEPPDLLPSGVPKWPANLVKKFTATYPLLMRLLKWHTNSSAHRSIYATPSRAQVQYVQLQVPCQNPEP